MSVVKAAVRRSKVKYPLEIYALLRNQFYRFFLGRIFMLEGVKHM